MKLEWDKNKNKLNKEKHGLDFSDVEEVFSGPTVFFEDSRHAYGESRWVVYGLLDDVVVCVVYTDRDDVIRVISMRKANKRERGKYEKIIREESAPSSISA
jgi:uncharacterized DUF497 family protein